jgi:mRNA interferase RelE/StbE
VNSNADWVLQIDPKVAKTLKKIPQNNARRIVSVIQQLPINPYAGDIQKMKGEKNVWRRRVGEYRIFYEVLTSESVLNVFHIERRTSTTY